MTQWELAQEFLHDAALCFDQGRYRSSASRSYYAAFHACITLFEHYGYRPANFMGRGGYPASRWEHGIIIKHFHLVFVVRRGLFRWAQGVEVRRLYRTRITADYKPHLPVSQALAEEMLNSAKELLKDMEEEVTT
jgi:uncharacterized protein (UPF0332 family)